MFSMPHADDGSDKDNQNQPLVDSGEATKAEICVSTGKGMEEEKKQTVENDPLLSLATTAAKQANEIEPDSTPHQHPPHFAATVRPSHPYPSQPPPYHSSNFPPPPPPPPPYEYPSPASVNHGPPWMRGGRVPPPPHPGSHLYPGAPLMYFGNGPCTPHPPTTRPMWPNSPPCPPYYGPAGIGMAPFRRRYSDSATSPSFADNHSFAAKETPKRPLPDVDSDATKDVKKQKQEAKPFETSSPSPKVSDAGFAEKADATGDISKTKTQGSGDCGARNVKKRIISPASSLEGQKCDDDESTGCGGSLAVKSTTPGRPQARFPHPHYPPPQAHGYTPHVPYPSPPPYFPVSYYQPPMHTGSYVDGSPRPQWGSYHFHGRGGGGASPVCHSPSPPSTNESDPKRSKSGPSPTGFSISSGEKASPDASNGAKTAREPSSVTIAIHSVADWQQATVATGTVPSANRCVPLKHPIPSRYWGEMEEASDVSVPDFHRLVNFPDYLTKSRSVDTTPLPKNDSGKRNCVMCGKSRICSATSLVTRNSSSRIQKKDDSSRDSDNDEGTHIIIPRQNKGLCTACDVTVWVVVESNMEIKWCKGCKNFRPWAAFGNKGSATKCVRCRDRQREKYAMQKGEIRLRRLLHKEEKRKQQADESNHDLEAANGLRSLMMTTVSRPV